MNNDDNPSIFTSKDSISNCPPPTLIRTPTDLTPRTSSPFNRRAPSSIHREPLASDLPPPTFALPTLPLSLPSTAPPPTTVKTTPTRSPWTTAGDQALPSSSPDSTVHAQSVRSNHDFTTAEPRFAVPQTAPTSHPTSTPPKRKLALVNAPESDPSRKRLKSFPRPKHTLNGFSFADFAIDQPPSPLFFSNSPRPRPELPPRFSSGEAAARMLSKARSEESGVKTVSLARGMVSTPGVAAAGLPTSAPYARRSLERGITARSSSPESGSSGPRESTNGFSSLLNSIGIVELLEQDERPTFIIDLGDSSNYGPGPIHPVFANQSLASYEGMVGIISGTTPGDESPGVKTFLQFKAWMLNATVNGESLNVCLPPFTFASMTWSCSTVRKRLRIISGAFNSPSAAATAAMRLSIPPNENQADLPSPKATLEPTDYFGAASAVRPAPPSGRSSRAPTEVISTIEEELSGSTAIETGSISASALIPPPDLFSATESLPTGSTFVIPSEAAGFTPGSTISASTGKEFALTNGSTSDSQLSTLPADSPFFDWTRLPLSDSMPPHIQFARKVNWAATSLGPIETWDADLRQMCNLIMASPHPAAMYWGDDLIAIYNEAYIMLAGQKHPLLMGMSYRTAWSEIWDEVKDVFASAKTTGEATMKDDDCLFLRRSNALEETYFSWSIIPMVGRNGSVVGLYNPAFEKTRRKIAERRMLTLREVGERTASARDVKGFWAQVLGSFEFNEYDSPFLILYSVTDENDSDSSSMHSNSVQAARQCMLEGYLGFPKDHQAIPGQIDLKSGMEGFGPVFRDVLKTNKPVLLEVGSRDLPESLLEGLETRGFGDPVKAVVVCPIHPTTGEAVLGFLVLGVNPRRPYDDDYSLFVQLLSRQLGTSLASVVLFEEEIRRGQRAAKLAALDRIELSEQLAARTQEAIESETKFTRMAEFAPVGMFIAGSDGKITFANDTWYDISRVPKNTDMADTWTEAVKPEDQAIVDQLWKDLVVHTKPVSSEFRFKADWHDRSGHKGETWVLFSGYPERYDDGRLKSIFGSITDISKQKWAEGIQTRKMEEAVELKRQQENFIDMTSHEMRNPLSAILQCSDEITSSLTQFKQDGNRIMPDDLLASCLEAAQTISLCSQHQKRIVDDILTLSKLDSQLLLVTPVDAQPLSVVRRTLKMHEGELLAADIQMRFVVDQSFRDLDLDWVRFDPSRVTQVLINLTTNAIKFTGTESRRTITVTIAASSQRPDDTGPVRYVPTRKKSEDMMDEKEWGNGEKVFIHFSVRDTGRGLTPEEKKLLFIRFSQASPRTHVQYGGSGLGLFISRELTELQGGEIGVESEAGKGSVFAFYVAARKVTPAKDHDAANGGPGEKAVEHATPVKTASQHTDSTTTTLRAEPVQAAVQPNDKPAIIKRVLIVEDNLVNQRVLQRQLKMVGAEVHLANHGGEALEKIMKSTYWRGDGTHDGGERLELGVVLMDQEMPVMDGLTCTKKIRELESEGKLTGHVPIIAVTANARAEQVQTARDAGMDDVVSKPFRIPELVPKIEELLARYPLPPK